MVRFGSEVTSFGLGTLYANRLRFTKFHSRGVNPCLPDWFKVNKVGRCPLAGESAKKR